jgi:hypothetical protein
MKLPKDKPANKALVVYLTVFSDTSNSPEREGRVSEAPWSQRLRKEG